uniref:Uncharacterized protein n=1 Tax=Tanacetum cinerariifolium TaxID=118510 RepID=A0A6L2NZ26_TANCI|nr:hypothetical protein [Tanacetum cinerariifolium]
MADENVPAPAPTRSDDQILPFATWLDKNWFKLDANLLREALDITPIDQAHQFESPSSGDAIMDFVNQLGFPGEIRFVSRMAVNNLYRPWRAILSMINQCITCKTSGFDRPRYPVLQMLWGIATKKDKKTKPHVIPYCCFTKLIFCYLGRTHNIHQRSGSPFNLAEDDLRHGNLKFIPKDLEDEHDRKMAAKEGGKKKSASKVDQSKKPTTAKQPKPVSSKQSKPALAKKPKVAWEKPSKPSPTKQSRKGKVQKVRKGKSSLQLVDEEEQIQPEPEPEPHGEGEEYDIERIVQELLIVEGKRKGIATNEQVAQSLLELQKPKKTSITDQYIFQRQILVTEEASTGPFAQPEDDTSANIVRDTSSLADAETGIDSKKANSEAGTEVLKIDGEKGEEISNTIALKEKIDEGQAGSDPCKTPKSSTPNLEPVHDDFIATIYPRVHEILKHETKEQVHLESPLSSSGTLSSMKNLDNFNFGDRFVNDNLTKEDPALQASLHERFKHLPEANIKEILHQRMFESGSYGSHLIHEALYKALEASMDRDNMDEFLDATVKFQKRCSWKTSDTRDVPSSSSKQMTAPQVVQPVDDILIPYVEHISNSEDICAAHLLKIKTRPDWLKPIPEEDRPKTPELDWVIPPNDLPEPKNNWADAIAKSQIGKSKLSKANLEGPAFKIDLVNPEGHRVMPDVSKPLPLRGPPGQRILERLDHMVKEFMLFKFNPSMDNQIWSEDDRRRSKDFIEVIERRLKT